MKPRALLAVCMAAKAQRLAELSLQLAPEHGRTTYGEPGRFLTPRVLYDRQAAEEAVALAGEALQIMKEIISREIQT